MAITSEQVIAWAYSDGIAGVDLGGVDASDPSLAKVVAAVNTMVADLPVVANGDIGPWPATVELGAVMLAARLFRRRNSPGGLEAFSEAGPVYVSRYDPDVATLLRLNAPAVG